MASHIQLTKKITLTAANRHRLQVYVSETTNNIPATIFVYQKIPTVPLDDKLADIFVHVASYADLGDFPENAPGPDSPFFRMYHVDLTFTSLAYLTKIWDQMERMVRHTMEDIARLNEDGPIEIIEVAA